jgi:hypothetical protein
VLDAPATILFVGDLVGGIGRRTFLALLPQLHEQHHPTFVVVNGENAAGGLGITPRIADELFAAGVDVITLGNHAYHRSEIFPYLDEHDAILRPANYLASQPGHGMCVVERDGTRLGVVNLSGNVFVRAGRHAFAEIDAIVHDLRDRCDHVLVDFHAEATSEKIAMGWHLDGRVTAVVGRPRPARRHGLHQRRGHDRAARRRDRRGQRAGDPLAGHAHVRALRDLAGRPVADGRAHPLLATAAARGRDRAAAGAVGRSAGGLTTPAPRPSTATNAGPRNHAA